MDPASSSDALRRAVWAVDADQPVWKVRTLDSLVDRSIQLERFLIWVLGLFGASALLLAVTGLSGVVAKPCSSARKRSGFASPSARRRQPPRGSSFDRVSG